jgi:hypothetical protein
LVSQEVEGEAFWSDEIEDKNNKFERGKHI